MLTMRGHDFGRRRWSIRWQLLVPIVSIVVLSSLLATGITVSWVSRQVRGEQQTDLRRVVQTLADSTFPLTERVLEQMSGLSGAHFVLLGPERQILAATTPANAFAHRLLELSDRRPSASHRAAVLALDDGDYVVDFVSLSGRVGARDGSKLFLLYPEAALATRIRQALAPAIVPAACAVVVAMAVATWLARKLVRPIQSLALRTSDIAAGDFQPIELPKTNDEVRDLIESINQMAARLADYERSVRQSERLRTLGQIGAAMAHQLRNAATGGRMAIELHQREHPLVTGECLEVALRQFRLMETYLRQFLAVSRPKPVGPDLFDASEVVQESAALLRPMAVHAGVAFEMECPTGPIPIHGDAEAFGQLASNLMLNAIEAARAGVSNPGDHNRMRVTVSLDCAEGKAVIRVADTGQGPPARLQESLFEPFVTGKADGVGLGLFVAREIAESHGGKLQWQRYGDKTLFEAELPMAASMEMSSNGTKT